MTRTANFPPREGGFTLLELVVGMGLLAGLLAVLVQILSTGVELFGEGERGQALADRTHTAARAVRGAFESTIGPGRIGAVEQRLPDARLLCYAAPLGFALEPKATRTQVVRATIALDETLEARLIGERVESIAAEEVESSHPAALAARVRELVARWPRSGRGELLLLPWPADESGAFLELRQGVWPADPELQAEGIVPLQEVEAPEDLALDPSEVVRLTRPVATGLLHVGFEFWSQSTTRWSNSGASGPLRVWDSARAGLLWDEERPHESFSLDLAPASLMDPRDDTWPHWVRITLVIGHGRVAPAEALLSSAVGASDREITLNRTDRLPDLAATPWVKVGAEWIKVGSVTGRRLGGLQRGMRGTTATDHASGTEVRAGRQVELVVRLPHGRNADV